MQSMSASPYDSPAFSARHSLGSVDAGLVPRTSYRASSRASVPIAAPYTSPSYTGNYPAHVLAAQGPNNAMAFQAIKDVASQVITKCGWHGKYSFDPTYVLDRQVPTQMGCTIRFCGKCAVLTIEQPFVTTPTEDGEVPSTLYQGTITAYISGPGPTYSAPYTQETIHSVFDQFISNFLSKMHTY